MDSIKSFSYLMSLSSDSPTIQSISPLGPAIQPSMDICTCSFNFLKRLLLFTTFTVTNLDSYICCDLHNSVCWYLQPVHRTINPFISESIFIQFAKISLNFITYTMGLVNSCIRSVFYVGICSISFLATLFLSTNTNASETAESNPDVINIRLYDPSEG